MLYAFTKMLEKNASIMCKFKGYRLVTFSSRIQDSTGKKFAGYRIPWKKICRIAESGFPYMLRYLVQWYENIACGNSPLSSLFFAAWNVSREGTSASQRQKFHTDDVN